MSVLRSFVSLLSLPLLGILSYPIWPLLSPGLAVHS